MSVLLLGEALIDELPGGPVAAGAPLNAARHLQAFGCAPLLVSRIGQDDAGARLIEAAMREAGLSLDGLQRDFLRPTGRVEVRMLEGGGHRFVIAEDVAWDHLEATPVTRADLVYFGSLAQRHAQSRSAIRALLQQADGLRFLDLNLREGVGAELALECLHLAHWVKVNDEELAQLLAWSGCMDAGQLIQRFELQRLVVTCGAQGYFSLGAQGQPLASGAGVPDVQVVDTVGAGDAFSACLLAAHLHGKDWGAGLALANRFAAAICGQAGASASDPASFYPPWQALLAALPEARP